MKTHNANIYHCVACGRVMHAELDAEPPQCCGHTMTKACAETIEGDAAGEKADGDSAAVPPVIKGRKKPR
jgi:hypothetical protein